MIAEQCSAIMWNSALPMLEEVLCQSEQLHIASIKLKNNDLSIYPEDERLISYLFKLLKPFLAATEELSGSTYIRAVWKKLQSEVDLLKESEDLRDTIAAEIKSRLSFNMQHSWIPDLKS